MAASAIDNRTVVVVAIAAFASGGMATRLPTPTKARNLSRTRGRAAKTFPRRARLSATAKASVSKVGASSMTRDNLATASEIAGLAAVLKARGDHLRELHGSSKAHRP